jgi:hypothetical protein
MTPEERQLITGLFDRMRDFSLAEKDREADALINEQMVSLRDAPYMLVQSVLVQEHALQQADARIQELEEQLRAAQAGAQQRPAGSGNFLGGLFDRRPTAEPARGPSVPVVGARATPPVYDGRPASAAWSSQQPPGQPGGPFAQGAQPAGGGFLRSAMTTAAGVAGGMLVAGAISNMLGGHSAQAGPAAASTQKAGDAADANKESAQSQEAAASKDDAYDQGYQDAADDAGGGWFGGDGGDFDI